MLQGSPAGAGQRGPRRPDSVASSDQGPTCQLITHRDSQVPALPENPLSWAGGGKLIWIQIFYHVTAPWTHIPVFQRNDSQRHSIPLAKARQQSMSFRVPMLEPGCLSSNPSSTVWLWASDLTTLGVHFPRCDMGLRTGGC